MSEVGAVADLQSGKITSQLHYGPSLDQANLDLNLKLDHSGFPISHFRSVVGVSQFSS